MSVAFQTKSPLLVKLCSHCTEQAFKRGIQTVVNLRIFGIYSLAFFVLPPAFAKLYLSIYLIYIFIYLFILMQVTNYLILLSLK